MSGSHPPPHNKISTCCCCVAFAPRLGILQHHIPYQAGFLASQGLSYDRAGLLAVYMEYDRVAPRRTRLMCRRYMHSSVCSSLGVDLVFLRAHLFFKCVCPVDGRCHQHHLAILHLFGEFLCFFPVLICGRRTNTTTVHFALIITAAAFSSVHTILLRHQTKNEQKTTYVRYILGHARQRYSSACVRTTQHVGKNGCIYHQD